MQNINVVNLNFFECFNNSAQNSNGGCLILDTIGLLNETKGIKIYSNTAGGYGGAIQMTNIQNNVSFS